MERPNAKGANNFIVGMFVFIAITVAAGFVVFMGGGSIFGRELKVRTTFDDVRGLNIGAPVFLSGIQVGRIASIEFPSPTGTQAADSPTGTPTPADAEEQKIHVFISIFSQYRERVRKDSEASISTQGVLGDKVLTLSPGTIAAGAAEKNAVIASQKAKELGDYFKQGANVVEDISAVAKNLNLLISEIYASGKVKSILSNLDKTTANLAVATKEDIGPALKSFRTILAKIEKGDGTLGALINDSSLHEDMRILLGGAKRSQVVRFLVRQAISANEKEQSAGERAADSKKNKK